MITSLANAPLISGPDALIAAIVAAVDDQNPDRINIVIPLTLSGNTDVKDVTLLYGFAYGTPQAA